MDRYQCLTPRRIKSIKNLIKKTFMVEFPSRVDLQRFIRVFSSLAHRRNGIVPSNLVSRRS